MDLVLLVWIIPHIIKMCFCLKVIFNQWKIHRKDIWWITLLCIFFYNTTPYASYNIRKMIDEPLKYWGESLKLTDKNDYHLQKNDDDNNDDPPMRTMDISLYLSIYIYVYINIYILFSLSEPHIDNFLDIFSG